MLKKIIILLSLTLIQSQYTVNLLYPFLLDNNYANISTVNWDWQNGFHVGFQNKQYRHYASDFSSNTKYNLSYVIQFMNSWTCSLTNRQLSNGTIWSTNASMTSTLSNNYRTLKVYNFTTMTEL